MVDMMLAWMVCMQLRLGKCSCKFVVTKTAKRFWNVFLQICGNKDSKKIVESVLANSDGDAMVCDSSLGKKSGPSNLWYSHVTQRFTNSLVQLSIFLIGLFVGTYRLSSHTRLEAFVIQTKLDFQICGNKIATWHVATGA